MKTPTPDPGSAEREFDNDSRIRELEARVKQRGRSGVRPFVSLAAIGVCIYFLFTIRLDVAYFFASRTPVTLGAEDGYHFDLLRSNVYAQLHGVPTTRGVYRQEQAETFVGVGMQGTPVIVWRKAFPSETWAPNVPPPRPDQTRLGVRGRLLVADDAKDVKDLFVKLGPSDHLTPVGGKLYVLKEGQRPGADVTPLLLLGVLVFFIVLNVGLLTLELRHRLRARGD